MKMILSHHNAGTSSRGGSLGVAKTYFKRTFVAFGVQCFCLNFFILGTERSNHSLPGTTYHTVTFSLWKGL